MMKIRVFGVKNNKKIKWGEIERRKEDYRNWEDVRCLAAGASQFFGDENVIVEIGTGEGEEIKGWEEIKKRLK